MKGQSCRSRSLCWFCWEHGRIRLCALVRLRRLDRLEHDAVRPAVVEHHEFDHRGQASTLLVRRRNQCGLHVWRNPDADDFGFGDGQVSSPV